MLVLNRRLIIENAYYVKQALSVRYPPNGIHSFKNLENLFETIDQVATLGQQAFDLNKQIEDLRRGRNQISDRFPKSSKEEKLALKQEISDIKAKIVELKILYEAIEKQCQDYEALVPNVPDPGIPLWSGISEHNEAYYRSALCIVHMLIDEYAGNRMAEDE